MTENEGAARGLPEAIPAMCLRCGQPIALIRITEAIGIACRHRARWWGDCSASGALSAFFRHEKREQEEVDASPYARIAEMAVWAAIWGRAKLRPTEVPGRPPAPSTPEEK